MSIVFFDSTIRGESAISKSILVLLGFVADESKSERRTLSLSNSRRYFSFSVNKEFICFFNSRSASNDTCCRCLRKSQNNGRILSVIVSRLHCRSRDIRVRTSSSFIRSILTTEDYLTSIAASILSFSSLAFLLVLSQP